MKPPPVSRRDRNSEASTGGCRFQIFPRDASGALVAGTVHEDEQSAVDAACAQTNAGEYLEVFVCELAGESAPRIIAYVVAGDDETSSPSRRRRGGPLPGKGRAIRPH
jgi:hypothetical protein